MYICMSLGDIGGHWTGTDQPTASIQQEVYILPPPEQAGYVPSSVLSTVFCKQATGDTWPVYISADISVLIAP